MTDERKESIEALLTTAFNPVELLVKDQSQLHAGHAGAKEGKGHFDVTIISESFSGRGRIERHRMVYDALDSIMESDIHALRINAKIPSERT